MTKPASAYLRKRSRQAGAESGGILQKVLEESLTDAYPTQRGPLPPVVFRETDTRKLQPLPEVPGKGKEKVGEEQAAQVLLHLQTPKKKGPAEQSDEEIPSVLEVGSRRRARRTDPGKLDEGQAGGPKTIYDVAEFNLYQILVQPQPEHMDEGFIATEYPEVQENLKLTVDEQMIPKEPVSSTGTLSSLQHLTKDFSYGD
ncbi:hypothetical protein Tco_1403589 [Tanacetum coccineum]